MNCALHTSSNEIKCFSIRENPLPGSAVHQCNRRSAGQVCTTCANQWRSAIAAPEVVGGGQHPGGGTPTRTPVTAVDIVRGDTAPEAVDRALVLSRWSFSVLHATAARADSNLLIMARPAPGQPDAALAL